MWYVRLLDVWRVASARPVVADWRGLLIFDTFNMETLSNSLGNMLIEAFRRYLDVLDLPVQNDKAIRDPSGSLPYGSKYLIIIYLSKTCTIITITQKSST